MHLTKLQQKQILARGLLYSLLLLFCISSTFVHAHDNYLINDYNCEVNLSDSTDNSATVESITAPLVSIQADIKLENKNSFQQKISHRSLSNRDPPLSFHFLASA